ncbi:hypothetical protein [Tautonia marina]|uniref:hypothetical protein n=1 Tax=Tautonia marina TaxID=2653855 RepID=UPI0012612D29|nr:hypothetical protein [Tautonia marina]
MRQRVALTLCGLCCVSVVTSLIMADPAARAARAEGEIRKMTPFDLPPSYGRAAVDIPSLNERGPSRLTRVQGSISIPIRYQIKTTNTFADAPHRLNVRFFEARSSRGEDEERDAPPEPLGSWTSPPFTPGDRLHINEVAPLTLPCPPGTYRIAIRVERYFEGIERTRGRITEWQVLHARPYPEVVVR